MSTTAIFPPEHMKAGADPYLAYVAQVRMQNKQTMEIIAGTINNNEEMQKVARSTDYEKNFSRFNLLV